MVSTLNISAHPSKFHYENHSMNLVLCSNIHDFILWNFIDFQTNHTILIPLQKSQMLQDTLLCCFMSKILWDLIMSGNIYCKDFQIWRIFAECRWWKMLQRSDCIRVWRIIFFNLIDKFFYSFIIFHHWLFLMLLTHFISSCEQFVTLNNKMRQKIIIWLY